ncbi:MAG: hypothetical protein H7Y04_15870 [Verrucomicrobia bacterium]|nr:hypothetical protein [Cytophagales bacterium]
MKIKIPVQALRVDIIAQTIVAVELKYSDVLQQLYDLIDCQTVSGFDLDDFHYCYMDDEGLLGEPEGYFMLPEFSYPIAGNAVIVGTNYRNGNDKSVKGDLLEKLRGRIIFFRAGEVKVKQEIRLLE